MNPGVLRIMTEQKMAALRADCSRRGRRPVPHIGRAAPGARNVTAGWRHLSEWAGYKMIGMGCRLARPALVARVRAEL
jgi:hypothetical protein